MSYYLTLIFKSFTDYGNYLLEEIIHPSWNNYFYYLIIVSLFVWVIEIGMPWRKNQKIIRKGFWLDLFYMFFNFFVFSLIGYNAIATVGVSLFEDGLSLVGVNNAIAVHIESWPTILQFLLLFVIADIIQWAIHIMLHRVNWMWEFHKVHHSVTEMGFAAHLRFHWMETIIYKTILYIPLTMIGFGIDDLFLLHAFTILIGHLNHANINWDYGPLKYILNNPHMHIWHHVKTLPKEHKNGINFGISLSVWDYIFKTAYIPSPGKNIELGFEKIEEFPESFIEQMKEPFDPTRL